MIAPDKFKGSLTAIEATEAIERGIERAVPNARCRRCPMADGGEGTVAVFLAHGAAPETVPVRGPRGGRVEAIIWVPGRSGGGRRLSCRSGQVRA